MLCSVFYILFCSFKLFEGASISNNIEVELSVIHINDFHARFEAVDRHSLTCSNRSDKCIGGFSRVYSEIQRLYEEYPDSIILNAGDSFQGTIWYTIYRWKAVAHFMNKIPFHAHTMGNHEFDDKIAGVVPYLKEVNAPIVVTNIDDSEEPTLQGLFRRSIIVERQGFRIGIIGVISAATDSLSSSEKLKFLDESESVNKEAERLNDEDHVDTIIVLSHSGYEVEKRIARLAVPKISLVVGGHSHSLLYTGKPPNKLVAIGPYPTVIEHEDGRKVLVVQASAFTKFLGHIFVKYNREGDVVSWSGEPIHLNSSVAQDPTINAEIAKWKETVDKHGKIVLGRTAVFLDGESCNNRECNLGNFITDAMISSIMNSSNTNYSECSPIAFINSGAIRTSLPVGDITVSRLLEIQPFGDTFDSAELQGKYIKEALEHSAKRAHDEGGIGLLQVSGFQVVYNMSKEPGSRVQSIKVLCSNEDMQMDEFYTFVTISYLMAGQDGYKMILENIKNLKIGGVDVDALTVFLQLHNPVVHKIEERIIIIR